MRGLGSRAPRANPRTEPPVPASSSLTHSAFPLPFCTQTHPQDDEPHPRPRTIAHPLREHPNGHVELRVLPVARAELDHWSPSIAYSEGIYRQSALPEPGEATCAQPPARVLVLKGSLPETCCIA